MIRNRIFIFIFIIGFLILVINLLYLKFYYINVKIINQKYIFNFLNSNKSNTGNFNFVKINYNFDKNYDSVSYYEIKFESENSNNSLIVEKDTNIPKCTIESCFNLEKCNENFKIFIYDEPLVVLTDIYRKILDALKSFGNDYQTQDPNEACLFITSLDTLDRDKLSQNYVNNLNDIINKLKYWNDGNHLIFNLYSGTWPNYSESLDFNVGKAIIAKASFSDRYYRKNFDISFPLFHSDLPFNMISYLPKLLKNKLNFEKKGYLLTFKGKRYLHGVGSETRNSIYHLNNNRDILLLTTCKHGIKWQELKDERCDADNKIYDKYEYNMLLNNSTFCLVPRGRRLGTYRFLEALKVGCIPVLLSNGWVLPFSEVLDWNKAVIWADERLLSHVPSFLRQIPSKKITYMKYYGLFFFNEYFSTVEKIIKTTIEIIKQRVTKNAIKPKLAWNEYPGSFYFDSLKYSNNIYDYPFYRSNFTKLDKFQVLFICNINRTFKERETNIKKIISFLNSFNEDKSNKFSIDNLILIDCFRDAQSNHEYLFNNIKFNLRIKEFIYEDNSDKFFKELSDFKALFLNSGFDSVSNCLLIVNEEYSYLLQQNIVPLGFNLWNDHQQQLIIGTQYYGFSNLNDKQCYEMSFNISSKNEHFMTLDFSFIHRFYLSYIINDSKLARLCYKTTYNLLDYFSKCLSNLINILVYKLTNKRPVLLNNYLLEIGNPKTNNHRYINYNNETCINDLFEYCFNINRKLFSSYFELV